MELSKLQKIVAALRDPDTGCPWDKQQDFKSIASYTLEEAYEVIEAIERENYAELKDELGDLLLQVVFHAQIASEKQLFDLGEVIEAISEKMWRRHPHVFGTDSDAGFNNEPVLQQDVKRFWEEEKARERAQKAQHRILEGVANALPALKRAQKLQKRAANVGFDWPDASGAQAKVSEEIVELEDAAASADQYALQEEMGDLLFACVNWARHLGLDAESCLLAANRKFEARFAAIEDHLQSQERRIEDCNLAELDEIWEQVKRKKS